MLTKRIIPCLDIKDGKVVKGINFVDLQDVGSPVALAQKYDEQGADEIVFLDIAATLERRKTMLDIIEEAASTLSIPLCVGGGISTIDDIKATLNAGADKVSLNSAALNNPQLVKEAALIYGSQSIVGAVDAKLNNKTNKYEVYRSGGKINTKRDLVEWVKELEVLGVGEILLTSMDGDGTKNGYDIAMLDVVCNAVNIPVIASGGCGSINDIIDVFNESNVDAALVASLFHYDQATIEEVKNEMIKHNIATRPV